MSQVLFEFLFCFGFVTVSKIHSKETRANNKMFQGKFFFLLYIQAKLAVPSKVRE